MDISITLSGLIIESYPQRSRSVVNIHLISLRKVALLKPEYVLNTSNIGYIFQ